MTTVTCVVQEAPRAHGPQRPLRQQPADFGAVPDGRLARLEHVHRTVYAWEDDALSRGGHARHQRDRFRGRIQVAHGPIVSLLEPDGYVSRLKGGMDHSGVTAGGAVGPARCCSRA
jgi:hypothetical protein